MEDFEEHTHNADPHAGPVCSHLISAECWDVWGLTIRCIDKVCGSPTIVRDGIERKEAFARASERGLIRICTIPPVVKQNWQPDPEFQAAMFVFAEAIVREKDRRNRE